MPTLYVDARSGNDANTGADWANAKKTLGAVYTAAATGDTILATGVFNEQLTANAAKILTFTAVGFAIIDRLSAASSQAFNQSSSSKVTFNGFIFQNAAYGIFNYINSSGAETVLLQDCIVQGCTTYGVVNYTLNCATRLLRTLVRDCAIGVGGNGPACGYIVIDTCTITDCTYGYHELTRGVTVHGACIRTVFSNNTYHVYVATNGATVFDIPFDYNLYNFSAGSCYAKATTYATLAAWQAGLAVDTHSVSEAPAFLDRLKDLHRLSYTSTRILDGYIPGAFPYFLGEGISDNLNDAIWDAPITLTDVEKDGNGDYVLSAGATEGIVEFEYDFVTPRNIRKINLQHTFAGLGTGVGGGPNGILDYDETDTLPETWTYRIDTSANGVDWDGYQEVDLFSNVNLTGVQMLRVEITLRDDA